MPELARCTVEPSCPFRIPAGSHCPDHRDDEAEIADRLAAFGVLAERPGRHEPAGPEAAQHAR